MKQKLIIGFIMVLMLVALNAQSIGEIAGPLNFQVAPGHNQTLALYIINGGSAPITLQVLNDYSIQYKSTQIANQITPIIAASPQNFTISGGKEQIVNITVSMPSKDTINASWSGIIQVVEISNKTENVSGAIINIGIAKMFSITAIKYIPPKNATVIKPIITPAQIIYIPNQLALHILEGFVGLVVIGGVVVYLIYFEAKMKKAKEALKKAQQKKQKKESRKKETLSKAEKAKKVNIKEQKTHKGKTKATTKTRKR
ncbi:MAG: hypothetical protein ACP5UN_01385 [Candidatus Micrarchaeia archaeon]